MQEVETTDIDTENGGLAQGAYLAISTVHVLWYGLFRSIHGETGLKGNKTLWFTIYLHVL